MSRVKVIGAVLLALLLVTSTGAAALSSSVASSAGVQPMDDPDTADEIFVAENGDAVLVFEEELEDATAGDVDGPNADEEVDLTGDFGFDVESGLIHLFVDADFADAVEDGEELETTGDASLTVTPDSIAGAADVTADQPEEIEALTVDIDHEQTKSTYDSTADVLLTVEDEDAADSSMSFAADTTMSASTFESDGSMAVVEAEEEAFVEPQDLRFEATITEDDGTYTLDVIQEQPVADTEWERQNWETEENAQQTLESQFNGIAVELGGSADVDLQSYEFEEGEEMHDLSVEYEVTFENVKEQVAEMLAEELERDQELDLDESEAQSIADGFAALEIDRAHVAYEVDGYETSAEWDVEIDNYDELVLASYEIAESLPDVDDRMAEQLDESRELFEAQADSGLEQTSSVSLSLDTEDGLTTLEFESESDAENWGDYVDEVEDRGLGEYLVESEFQIDAEIEDEELTTDLSFELIQEGALETALEEAIAAAEEDPTADAEVVEALESFRDAEFEAAKANATLTDTSVTGQAAAQFGNLSSFETDDGHEVTGVHGEVEGDVTKVYVSIAEYVGENPTESEVREQDEVDDDTVVHMPGEWDDDDLPETDVESLTQYLSEDDDSSALPVGTTGIAVAGVLAVLAVAGAVAYRRFN